MTDLSKICIRARSKGHWESLTLEEIFDEQDPEALLDLQHWFYTKALQAIGLSEGEPITKEHLIRAVEALEKLGIVFAKLK